MDVRALLPNAFLLLFALAAGGQQRLSDQQANLVHLVAKQAAFAEVSTASCAQRNARNAAQYTQAWQSWQQRNHWAELQSGAAATELRPGEYNSLKAETQQKLASMGGFRMAMVCAGLIPSLATAQFDSSAAHGQELATIAGMSGAMGTPVSPSPSQSSAAPPTQQPSAEPSQATQSTPATPTAGPAQTAGPVNNSLSGVQFTPPPGWTPGKSMPNGSSFTLPGKGLVLVIAQSPMQGDLAASFQAAVRASFPVADLKLELETGKTPQGLPAASTRGGGKLNGGRYTSLRAVGIALPGNRLLLMELVSRAGALDSINAEKQFQATVRSVQVPEAPQTVRWDVLHPAKGSGGLQGLFWATQLQNQINPLGGMDLRAERYYVLLLPSGQVYTDLPTGGRVFDMDFAAKAAKEPQHCGTYTVSGSAIHYIFPNEYGLLIESDGKTANDSVTRDGRTLFRVKPAQSMRLSGKYTSTFAMVGNGVSNTTSVSSEHSITFTPDGRYQRSHFSGASGSNFAISNRSGTDTGSYEMSGYTLKLTPAGGSTPEIFTVVIEDASSSPKALFIDDNAYLR